ncbi:MAG: LytR family transcriptional regulator [Treponema bryantii]|nr:LytR family transcriptional regulator [Treponema bryantii]
MNKIRDEQKGIIFIAAIFVIIISLGIFFSVSLKTNKVEETLKTTDMLRVLYVVEDENTEMLFSSVLTFYPKSNKGALINLPSYTGAIYNTLGRVDRLSTVYNATGIAGFKQEVEKMLGIQVHFTSTISLTNFIKLCDIVGGVRVFIPNPVDYVSEEGERWLLPSGAVNLDGDKVRVYLKYKLDDETETDVQERYQNIMAAFLTGLHDKNFILFNNNTYQLINNCINTNLREDEEETLYSMIAAIDTESLIHQTITGSWRNVDNQQLLMPLNNGEFIKEAVKQLTNMLKSEDGTITSRVYVIEIKNGTEIQGLARRTSTLYKDASYDVLAAVNADSQDYEQTVIIDHIGNETAAKNVGELIRCTNIKQIDSTTEVKDYTSEAKVDFTIILGKDFNGRYVVKKSSN